MKHNYRPGQRVRYIQRSRNGAAVLNYLHADVVRVSRNRIIIQDGFGRKYYVKPVNLASLTLERKR